MECTSSTESKKIDRVNLACVQCRSRHVKCDATIPICNRCRRDGKECQYRKSRRGGLDKAALARRRLMLQQQQGAHNHGSQQKTTPEFRTSSDGSPNSGESDEIERICKQFSFDGTLADFSNELSFSIKPERLLDVYYEIFHRAHPVVLPKHFLLQRARNKDRSFEILMSVMRYIGSIYAPWTSPYSFRAEAEQALFGEGYLRSGFYVQALNLFAIAQAHSNEKTKARNILNTAISVALELGMNKREFAVQNGEGNPVLEEAWRRTYYLLFYTDENFAIVTNNPTFPLQDILLEVDLPCEDDAYERGQIPQPSTWQEYEVREFSDVEIVYSSFTYLLDIARIVSFVLLGFLKTGDLENVIQTADAKLAIWRSLLPACKRAPLKVDGSIDEVMLLALIIDNGAMTHMHRPFSSLSYSIEEFSTTNFLCTAIPMAKYPFTRQSRSSHTAKTLKAIEYQTRLLAIPCTLSNHTPFISCIIAGLAAAQISACTVLLQDHALDVARDRLRLSIGALSALGELWPLAKAMAQEVKTIARSVLIAPLITAPPAMGPTDEIEIPRDDLLWSTNPLPDLQIYSGLEIPSLPLDWDPTLDAFNTSIGV